MGAQDLYKKALEICSKNRESKIEKVYRLVMEKAEKQFSKIKKDQLFVDNLVELELYIGSDSITLEESNFEVQLRGYFVDKGFKSHKIKFVDKIAFDDCGEWEVTFIQVDFS